MPSDLELIELWAATLFRHDARGRLRSINETDPGGPAPRLFLGWTAHLLEAGADAPS